MNDTFLTNAEYVDVHGRSLSVMIKSDGTVYIPLHEIRKTGFHIFTKSDYNKPSIGKPTILEELRLYLLGAAKEFLIQKDVASINNGEIQKSIEECSQKVAENGLPSKIEKSPTGVLGRTLLRDPLEISKTTKFLPQTLPQVPKSDNIGSFNQINKRNFPKPNDSSSSLRMPHNQNDNKKPYNHEQNEQNRSYQTNNNIGYGKKYQRTNSESKSSSENEDGTQYVKLSNLTLKRVELQTDMQDVKVVHVDNNNEKLKFWVQLIENDEIVTDIMEKCNEVADNCAVVQPKIDEIYLAQHKDDQLWYRVIVTRVNPVTKAHFIDFGNDAVVTELRAIPDNLKSIPGQAVRIVVSKPEGSAQVILELEEVLTVKKIKQFVDTTYVVHKCNKNLNSTPPQRLAEPILINEIKYSKNLLKEDTVKIVSYSEGKLYLRNKEHHSKLVEVDMEIKDLTRQAVKDVVLNQLVLCKKEGSEEKLCRAIVKKIENNTVTVHFMDYHKNAKVSINNIFAGNKSVANIAATLIEIPLRGYSISKFNANTAAMLEEMIANNLKFTVEKIGNDFDLSNKGVYLSEMLFPTASKSQPTVASGSSGVSLRPTNNNQAKQSTSDKYVKVMFEDMILYEAPIGKGDYMLTNYKDPTEFTVTSTNDKESDMLSRCTGINVTDQEEYEPDETEMVLAFFEGDWYRGLALDKIDGGVYQILFVEYGNINELTKKDLRRFPREFKDIPILGLTCQLEVKNTEAIRNRLEQLFEPNNIYEINFLSYSPEAMQYSVEIPKITQILRQEGLL